MIGFDRNECMSSPVDVVVKVNMLLDISVGVSPKSKPLKDCNTVLVVASLAVFFFSIEMLSPIELIADAVAGFVAFSTVDGKFSASDVLV